ncbi:MAG: 2-hydroxychromene-2-carboxylate isomerase [Alphaproteobacteria bacterium]
MMRTITYFHSLSSPWAYLGGPRFHEIVRRHSLSVVLRPVTIISENGGIPLRTRPQARQDYHELELDRWRKHLGMPLNLRPRYYPTDPTQSARMVIAADRAGFNALNLSHALLRALWAEEQDTLDPAVRRRVADGVGLDGAALVVAENSPDVIFAWEASRAEAVTSAVFGTPTYIYKGERFWGQDRLDFLDRAVQRDT